MTTPEFAREWARSIGAPEASLRALRGGLNNVLYVCEGRGRQFVIKGYPRLEHDSRDRMQAEVSFLRYAGRVAPQYVPTLLEVDADLRCIVMEHIEGRLYEDGTQVTQADVRAASTFYGLLNEDLETAKVMVQFLAAEAYSCVTEHLQNVRQRIGEMKVSHLQSGLQKPAHQLIQQLQQCLEQRAESIAKELARGDFEDKLDFSGFRVSPSDFGFHNAILTSKGVRFFDFEFSGWDDPAKTLADFFLQPRIPVSADFNGFLTQASIKIPQRQRLSALASVLSLKWACIVLGVLNPARALRLSMIDEGQMTEGAIRLRLSRGSDYIRMETPVGLH